jgi:zinc/manganese transport system substrate-binding protein
MLRIALSLALLATLLSAPAAAAQSTCQFRGGFVQLQQLIPDRVGACVQDEQYRPDIGQSTQRTSNGTLVWHSVDGSLSFSDGFHTWVLDPNGHVQVRNVDERLAFEFNGDGFPIVGQPAPNTNAACPTAPIAVLAVANFFANLVQQLGGQCVSVTTILSDPDADPHEFEPTFDDVRAFQGAALVILNGLGYDDFADRIIDTMSQKPLVVRAGNVVGLEVGANPHVWYSAGYVDQIKAAMVSSLTQARPDASGYFDAQASVLEEQRFATYRQLIAQIAGQFGGTPVGATESIFVDMSYSTGLRLITPPGFLNLAEDAEPAAQDIAAFQDQIKNKQIKVLVYNVQTATPITDQLKELAIQNDIPIVGVSETMPVGAQTFQCWQAGQLLLLLNALQKSASR